MTMDVNNRKADMKSALPAHGKSDDRTNITPVKVAKRPFDVAFLMLPDEKLKKDSKIVKNYENSNTDTSENNNESVDEDDEEIEVGNNYDFIKVHQKQVFEDPTPIKAKNLDELRQKASSFASSADKSAFTKVNLVPKDVRVSPGLSISPDLSYQNSLSPSPPIINRAYPPNLMSPNQIFKHHHNASYHNNFMADNFHQPENPFIIKNPNELIPKIRPVYRPDLPYNYQQFPTHQDMLKMSSSSDMRNPAAAILTSLLPPSLAALSLPAQNVCAKCNISFRMTSDLVYHMRSHHKNDTVDMHKRRREEKLKCPVCAESFRERHHLTRHMTAHQDKDNDEANVTKKSN